MGNEENVKKGAWSALEDKILLNYIQIHGEGNWKLLSQRAGLKRCGKSCRMRWMNYLRPDIKRGNISKEEEDLIIKLHNLLGNRWSLIAKRLPGRTDNEIKNYWNTHLRKRVENTKSTNSKGEVTTNTIFRPKPVRCSKVREFQSSSTSQGEEHTNSGDLQLDFDINELIFENSNFDWHYSIFCDICPC